MIQLKMTVLRILAQFLKLFVSSQTFICTNFRKLLVLNIQIILAIFSARDKACRNFLPLPAGMHWVYIMWLQIWAIHCSGGYCTHYRLKEKQRKQRRGKNTFNRKMGWKVQKAFISYKEQIIYKTIVLYWKEI